MEAREYKYLREATAEIVSDCKLKRRLCKHDFVASRLDKFLFPDDADNLYITCIKCGQQYIIDKLF